MKSLFIILTVSLTLFANELKWVDEQIEAIKPARNGISKSQIDAVENPFVFLHQTKKKASKKRVSSSKYSKGSYAKSKISTSDLKTYTAKDFTLSAIINKAALINGKWYKLNSYIGKYELSDIDKTNVVLSYKTNKIFLTTAMKNKKIKFNNN